MPLFLTYRGNWFYTQTKSRPPLVILFQFVRIIWEQWFTYFLPYPVSSGAPWLCRPLCFQLWNMHFFSGSARVESQNNSRFKTTEMHPPSVRNPKCRCQHGHAHTEGSREPFLWSLLGIPSVPVCFQSLSLHTSLLKRVLLHVHPP